MDISLILENWQLFAMGLWNTIWLVTVSLIVGGLLALPLAMSQAFNVPIAGRISYWFSYSFRGTPLLVQLYLIYYGLGQFDFIRESFLWVFLKNAYVCALIAFSLNSAAYASEIIRGAICQVPKNLIETAHAMGMSEFQVIRRIILPIAYRRSIFAYSNEVIFMLHGSVLASTITIIDLLGAGRKLNISYYVTFEGFVTAAVLYMAIVFLISMGFRVIEKKYAIDR
ncbi:ABC transporter permease subunit [Ruegeria sp.]|uniref:ABC transporter permease n=1 Tax=Ruegeria sp. TaxID=1879320 RepID=UPI00231FE06E|nr:ABC transporter permease subunit [Ruegeria sp.]MDA7965341.1 ABC transporter permease subunit [Ruegeria sp.]